MTRLRENALLNSYLPFLYKDTTGTFKILFQNVRSLHLHFPDIASDYNVKVDDFNICVQTALCSSDNNDLYQIPSFQLFRNDFISHGMRTPYGTAVYVQENVQLLTEPLRCNYNNVEMTFINVNQPVPNLHIVQISRSKGENLKICKYALRNLHSNFLDDPYVPIILLGDFNINLMENTSEKNSQGT